MAAKKGYNRPGFLTDEHRGKIASSSILNALIEHTEGRREMTSTQVTAGIALLKKVMPDLSAIDHSGEVTTPFVMRAPMPAETAEAWEKDHKPTIN